MVSILGLARIGNVRLAYESLGSDTDPPAVMIHGLGQQLTGWPDGLVEGIVRAGYRVIRFDNRDVGKSSRLSGRPRLASLHLLTQLGLTGSAPYSLDDLAHGTVSLNSIPAMLGPLGGEPA
ncbi:hypothetical protein P3W85_01350 [Cupriavidus basilensis]|uniref:AB hydrolase-1 domain-containing protein n=1 Tax=Cupriavidus basilensis TaxID=68895 RepID=A0ABT6AGM0_9BURK|nr:alpha/beta fold hydrolase [Cupriavidus basilensis]MDF3831609.1 hypothetical protein [Cupriavidus basilensis]